MRKSDRLYLIMTNLRISHRDCRIRDPQEYHEKTIVVQRVSFAEYAGKSSGLKSQENQYHKEMMIVYTSEVWGMRWRSSRLKSQERKHREEKILTV